MKVVLLQLTLTCVSSYHKGIHAPTSIIENIINVIDALEYWIKATINFVNCIVWETNLLHTKDSVYVCACVSAWCMHACSFSDVTASLRI